MDELELLFSKTEDLSYICQKNNYPEFSKFLDLTQQARIKNIKTPGCRYYLYGGFDDAERKIMGCFPADYECSEEYFPIKTLKITPAEMSGLTHRDYLGALVGLGIKRECIGDISLTGDGAYCFCTDEIADFIIFNLKSVGRTSAKVTEAQNVKISPREYNRFSGTVASTRMDAVMAAVIGTSRTKIKELIAQGRVMVNYLPAKSESAKLKPGDVISARGFGKFIFLGENGPTKKGRLKIEADIYK